MCLGERLPREQHQPWKTRYTQAQDSEGGCRFLLVLTVKQKARQDFEQTGLHLHSGDFLHKASCSQDTFGTKTVANKHQHSNPLSRGTLFSHKGTCQRSSTHTARRNQRRWDFRDVRHTDMHQDTRFHTHTCLKAQTADTFHDHNLPFALLLSNPFPLPPAAFSFSAAVVSHGGKRPHTPPWKMPCSKGEEMRPLALPQLLF